jgi:hypothetical protein
MFRFKKMTTTDHSYAAHLAIRHHCNIVHEHYPEASDLEEGLIELLADLMHFAGDEQHFEQCLTTAKLYYWAQKGEQP